MQIVYSINSILELTNEAFLLKAAANCRLLSFLQWLEVRFALVIGMVIGEFGGVSKETVGIMRITTEDEVNDYHSNTDS